MNTQTYLLIILAIAVSLGLVFFQYFYKQKKRRKLNYVLAFLRFLVIFGALFLLINPKFTKYEYTIEKANLIVLADNSTSVAPFKDDLNSIIENLDGDKEINQNFNLEKYKFGPALESFDSLSFNAENTNISAALSALQDIYSTSNSVIVLLSDGNQTLGQDYEFYGKKQKLPIYPVAVGDTISYEDLAISRVNTNRYAFLKNKFPVEIYISYDGENEVNVPVSISLNGKTVFRENASFSKTKNSKAINTLLDATSVGIKNIVVTVGNLENEKNLVNNKRELAIEVIDEKTNIVLVSNLLHPDVGALKKSIETNEQRSVSISKPSGETKSFEEVDLFILYQPDASFKALYDYISQKKASFFTITGSHTDWNFLNSVQNSFSKDSYNQSEEIFPVLNRGFGLFDISDFSIQDFPPLLGNLGEISLREGGEILLNQRIRGVDLQQPLMMVFIGETQRQAVLFSENIWKWRMQSYRNEQRFDNFDDFMGKLILYLTTNASRDRLSLEYESVVKGTGEAKISAVYFDNTFTFDADAKIELKITNSDTKNSYDLPMLLKGNGYEADLSNLPAGKYNFSTKISDENLSKSGSFSILDFDREKQFPSTNFKKLNRLAENTGGILFYPEQLDGLLQSLLQNNGFLPTQKSSQNVVSLIDFQILLAIMVLALAMEWFIRKYNGLT